MDEDFEMILILTLVIAGGLVLFKNTQWMREQYKDTVNNSPENKTSAALLQLIKPGIQRYFLGTYPADSAFSLSKNDIACLYLKDRSLCREPTIEMITCPLSQGPSKCATFDAIRKPEQQSDCKLKANGAWYTFGKRCLKLNVTPTNAIENKDLDALCFNLSRPLLLRGMNTDYHAPEWEPSNLYVWPSDPINIPMRPMKQTKKLSSGPITTHCLEPDYESSSEPAGITFVSQEARTTTPMNVVKSSNRALPPLIEIAGMGLVLELEDSERIRVKVIDLEDGKLVTSWPWKVDGGAVGRKIALHWILTSKGAGAVLLVTQGKEKRSVAYITHNFGPVIGDRVKILKGKTHHMPSMWKKYEQFVSGMDV
jgi:hypothetical protein